MLSSFIENPQVLIIELWLYSEGQEYRNTAPPMMDNLFNLLCGEEIF